jgi:hypothetical protein
MSCTLRLVWGDRRPSFAAQARTHLCQLHSQTLKPSLSFLRPPHKRYAGSNAAPVARGRQNVRPTTAVSQSSVQTTRSHATEVLLRETEQTMERFCPWTEPGAKGQDSDVRPHMHLRARDYDNREDDGETRGRVYSHTLKLKLSVLTLGGKKGDEGNADANNGG